MNKPMQITESLPLGEQYCNQSLTVKETRIALSLLDLRDIQSVAENNHVSRKTVEYHLTNIRQKLFCKNSFDLALKLNQLFNFIC